MSKIYSFKACIYIYSIYDNDTPVKQWGKFAIQLLCCYDLETAEGMCLPIAFRLSSKTCKI